VIVLPFLGWVQHRQTSDERSQLLDLLLKEHQSRDRNTLGDNLAANNDVSLRLSVRRVLRRGDVDQTSQRLRELRKNVLALELHIHALRRKTVTLFVLRGVALRKPREEGLFVQLVVEVSLYTLRLILHPFFDGDDLVKPCHYLTPSS
jgi:hypothetical protein